MLINHLPQIMEQKAVSIRRLSKMTGITYTTIRALYHGQRRSIQLDVLAAICEALQIQPGDIYRLESGRLESGRLESGRLESGRLESGRLESGRLESERLESGRLESERYESDRLESDRHPTGGDESAGEYVGKPSTPPKPSRGATLAPASPHTTNSHSDWRAW